MLSKIAKFLRKREPEIIRLGMVAVIEPTSFEVDDKFNKNIVIYEGVEVVDGVIRWGRKIKEIPYTEEDVKNIQRVYDIPVVVREIHSKKIKFYENHPFGDLIN